MKHSDAYRNALFLGGPWFVAIFQLPQRFQVIHGSSGTMAGVQTMPFTFAAPLGSAIASILAKKGPAVYVVILSGILQTIGFALLASVPVSTTVPARVYGFQVIAGFGCGINISTLILLVPFVVEYRDKGRLDCLKQDSGANRCSCRHGSRVSTAHHRRCCCACYRNVGFQ